MFREVYLMKPDLEFATSSSPEVFRKYDVQGKAVVLFKKVGFTAALLPPAGGRQRFLGETGDTVSTFDSLTRAEPTSCGRRTGS